VDDRGDLRSFAAVLMRVLLANEARTGAGGVETYLAAIADGLRGRGHEVALLFANSAAESGPTAISCAEQWSVADGGLASAIEQARRWRPDVCFAHNMRDLDVDEALLDAGPVVKMMHGYFGTCVSGQKACLAPAPVPCSRRCGPACLIHYAPRRCGRLRPAEMLANYRWAARQRALFPRYRSLVVASRHMRDEYVAHGVGADRVHAIPLFASTPAAPPAADLSTDVLFLGRMTDLKGPSLLLDAAARASNAIGRRVSVVMAGEGPLRSALSDRVRAMPTVDARFPGWVDAPARAALFSRSRMLAVPSVWPEPFGLVGLEAAASGVPAIAFDVGGIREWLTDDVNGRLVAAGDTGARADAMAALLRNPVERTRLSEGARAAAARLSPEAHLSRLEAVLERAPQCSGT
jgi:glycosyltransferase involved in cell wall biosynthesis